MNAQALRAAVVAGLLQGASAWALADPELTLHTLEWAPYSWTDKTSGNVVGIAVDIVNELMARANMPVRSLDIAPWARGLALTATTPGTCQLMVGRTVERDPKYKWIGPIGQSTWMLFAPRADKITLQRVEDARPYLVGTIIDDLSIPLLKSRGVRVAEVASDRLNPPKLLRHRIDLWSSAYLPALYIMRDLGIKNVEPVLNLATIDMYMACHRGMKDSDVARLNHIIRAMAADKSIERIYTGYGYGGSAYLPTSDTSSASDSR